MAFQLPDFLNAAGSRANPLAQLPKAIQGYEQGYAGAQQRQLGDYAMEKAKREALVNRYQMQMLQKLVGMNKGGVMPEAPQAGVAQPMSPSPGQNMYSGVVGNPGVSSGGISPFAAQNMSMQGLPGTPQRWMGQAPGESQQAQQEGYEGQPQGLEMPGDLSELSSSLRSSNSSPKDQQMLNSLITAGMGEYKDYVDPNGRTVTRVGSSPYMPGVFTTQQINTGLSKVSEQYLEKAQKEQEAIAKMNLIMPKIKELIRSNPEAFRGATGVGSDWGFLNAFASQETNKMRGQLNSLLKAMQAAAEDLVKTGSGEELRIFAEGLKGGITQNPDMLLGTLESAESATHDMEKRNEFMMPLVQGGLSYSEAKKLADQFMHPVERGERTKIDRSSSIATLKKHGIDMDDIQKSARESGRSEQQVIDDALRYYGGR